MENQDRDQVSAPAVEAPIAETVSAPVDVSLLDQKTAVYNAIDLVLKDHQIAISEGDSVKDVLKSKKNLRKEVNAIVLAGFENGTVKLSKSKVGQELKNYASSVVGNWLNKDDRLN